MLIRKGCTRPPYLPILHPNGLRKQTPGGQSDHGTPRTPWKPTGASLCRQGPSRSSQGFCGLRRRDDACAISCRAAIQTYPGWAPQPLRPSLHYRFTGSLGIPSPTPDFSIALAKMESAAKILFFFPMLLSKEQSLGRKTTETVKKQR